VRRVLLLNALIFAVLAAAAALAYYGYVATSGETSRERELALMQDLAEEKVLNIEFLIDDANKKLMRDIELDQLSRLQKKVEASGAGLVSVVVLDEARKLVPDGSLSARPEKDAKAFRDWMLANVLPQLPLADHPVDERGHLYLNLDRPYLFSFMRRVSGGRTFYVVLEDDLVHLVRLCEQFFFITDESKRLYQVLDDRGQLRCGPPFRDIGEGLVVERRFASTWDGFVLRVAQKDLADLDALQRKRVVNAVILGGAVAVILGGLLVLGFAIRRERRLSALKSEFISNVSHELKTPLSIISMFGELLALGRTRSAEQAHEYAEIIWRESVRLGRLIDNVLDFAKIGAPRRGRADDGLDRPRGRSAAGAPRSQRVHARGAEPHRQRDQIRGRRPAHRGVAGAARRPRGARRPRSRPGHPRRGARADLRALLPRPRGAAAADPRLGDRARARPAHRARARRRRRAGEPPRAGRDVPDLATDRPSDRRSDQWYELTP
jgi:hypothetical protein